MFKVSKKLVPAPTQEPFPIYDNIHNLRSQRSWKSQCQNSRIWHGIIYVSRSKNMAPSSGLN